VVLVVAVQEAQAVALEQQDRQILAVVAVVLIPPIMSAVTAAQVL
jgi:hypothetical protein